MRIGRVMIDTDNMDDAELTFVINELRKIRSRKREQAILAKRMVDLINDAKEKHFTFIDKDYGNVWTVEDFTVFDEGQ